MKKVVSFMNMKGGVAKTTLAVNLASYLTHKENKRVLFIDMDPQFNATQYLFSKYNKEYFGDNYEKANATIIDLFNKGEPEITNIISGDIKKTKVGPNDDLIINLREGFDIIPGDLELIKLDFSDRGKEQELLNYIDTNELKSKYDFIFIDSAPTYSFYTLATYIASDCYLMPVKPDYFSSLGISLFHAAFDSKAKQYRLNIEQLGTVFTVVEPSTTVAKKVMDKLNKNLGDLVFENFLKKAAQIPLGVDKGQLMIELDEDVQDNISKIGKEFIERMDRINGH